MREPVEDDRGDHHGAGHEVAQEGRRPKLSASPFAMMASRSAPLSVPIAVPAPAGEAGAADDDRREDLEQERRVRVRLGRADEREVEHRREGRQAPRSR